MKRLSTRIISVVLAVLLVIPCGVIFASADTEPVPFTYVSAANSVSSSYASSRFYEYLNKLTITGDQRTDIVAIALTQAGYLEGSSAGQYGGTTAGYSNFCEYNYNMGDFGIGYGGDYQWCASFVSWALLQSRIYSIRISSMNDWARYHDGVGSDPYSKDVSYMWREVGCGAWQDQIERAGYFKYSRYQGGDYKPQTGDIIFFSWTSSADSEDHVGLVVYSDDNYVYTVEGNTSDAAGLEDNGGCCAVKSYSLGSSYIIGYGAMPYKSNPEYAVDFSGENRTTGYYINTEAAKYVYTDESCSGNTVGVMSRFTMFEVTQVCSNGMLKVITDLSDGTEDAVGYINPDPVAASRVFQLSVSLNPEQKKLQALVNEVEGIRYFDYTENTLRALREAYAEAVALLGNSSASAEQYNQAYDKLYNLYINTGTNEAKNGVFIDAFDERITNGKAVIFTPDTGIVNGTNGGHTWSANIKAKWDEELKCFVVTERISMMLGTAVEVTLNSGEIMIAAHDWETNVSATEGPVRGSAANYSHVANVQVGDLIIPSGVNFETRTLDIGAYVNIISPDELEAETSDIAFNLDGEAEVRVYKKDGSLLSVMDEARTLTVTEDISFTITPADGWALMGVTDDNGDITPVDGSYTVAFNSSTAVNITLGAIPAAPAEITAEFTLNEDGETYSATIPEIENALYSFDGINFSETNVKADCTAETEYTVYVKIVDAVTGLESAVVSANVTSPELPEDFVLGDINNNGSVDMTDYVLAKRAYFGTYKLTEDEFKRGNVNFNEEMDMTDYVLIKRVYFGTYSFEEQA